VPRLAVLSLSNLKCTSVMPRSSLNSSSSKLEKSISGLLLANWNTKDLREKLLDILTIRMSKKKPRKRIEIKGHYMEVRQRSTKKGKKGTIMGKWKPEKKTTKKKKK